MSNHTRTVERFRSFPTVLSNGQYIAIVLAAALCKQAVCQQLAGPNPLIEASRYAARARMELDCTVDGIRDPVGSAKGWVRRAIDTGRRFKTTDKVEQGQAGSFLARQEQFFSELERRQAQLGNGAKSIAGFLKRAYIESAQRTYAELNPPACDEKFRKINDDLTIRRTQFRDLMLRADQLATSDTPSAAIQLYLEARTVNAESEDVATGIAAARSRDAELARAARLEAERIKQQERAARGGRSAGKTIVYGILLVAVLGGLGFAAYKADQAEKRRQGR